MIYLASPYTHANKAVMQQRYEQAQRCMFWMITTRPDPVYSPIVHFHDFTCKFDLPRDAGWWKATNFNMIRRCNSMAVLVVSGVTTSKGVQEEIELAQYLMMPVEYVNQSGLEVVSPWR